MSREAWVDPEQAKKNAEILREKDKIVKDANSYSTSKAIPTLGTNSGLFADTILRIIQVSSSPDQTTQLALLGVLLLVLVVSTLLTAIAMCLDYDPDKKKLHYMNVVNGCLSFASLVLKLVIVGVSAMQP